MTMVLKNEVYAAAIPQENAKSFRGSILLLASFMIVQEGGHIFHLFGGNSNFGLSNFFSL